LGRVLQRGLREARQLGGGQRVAATVKERVAVLLLRGHLCRSSDVGHTQGVDCRVTAGVEAVVEAGGGSVDQGGHAVRVLGVAFEGGVGWGRASGWAVAVSCSQVILQTLHIFRVADPQQLRPLACAQERLEDGGVVVEASRALHRHGRHGGEDGRLHLGWSWLWVSGVGDEGEEAVGVEVRVAHLDGSGLDGGGHHQRSLWLAGGLGNALWILRVGTRLVDRTEVLEVVVESRALL